MFLLNLLRIVVNSIDFFGVFMFNIGSFLARTGHTHESLAKKISCSPGLIGMYASQKSVPSYEKIEQLLKLGMTIEEMFGQEAAEQTHLFVQTEEELQGEANSFKDKVGEAIVELLNGGFFKLKARN